MFLGIVEKESAFKSMQFTFCGFSATAVYWVVARAVHRAAWSAVAAHHWALHGSAAGDWELQKAATGATGWVDAAAMPTRLTIC